MAHIERIFVPTLIAFLVGVGVAAYLYSSFALGELFLFLGAATLGLSVFFEDKRRLILIGACLIGVGFGVIRFTSWEIHPLDPAIVTREGERVVLRGVVVDEPDVRETNTHLHLTVEGISAEDGMVGVHAGVLAIVPRYPEYRYGDLLELRGKLVRPEAFSGDDGRIFDYPNYLKAKGITHQLFYPEVVVVEQDKGNVLRAKLFSLKQAFLERLARVLPEPENALAGGILLGGKRSLGEEWSERFRETGLIHIVVLSGYNMTIIAEWLGAAFLFLGFYGSIAASALGITLFALMAGAGATVVRAAIMALLVLLARLTGRTGTMGRGLLIAGVFMVLHNPSILAFDPSFQLSFLAALGLVFVAPIIRLWLPRLRKHPIVEEAVVATLATQVMVLPLLLYQTGLFSVIAPFTNVLVLPVIPVAMAFTFVTGMVGFVGAFLAFLPALPTQALLAYVLLVAEWGTTLPFAAVHLPPIPGWSVFCLYGVLALTIARFARPLAPPQIPPEHP